MGHTVVDVADIQYVWGTFKFVRHHLGAFLVIGGVPGGAYQPWASPDE